MNTPIATKAKRFRVLSPYQYRIGDGLKTGWTEVGIAFSSRDGLGVNIELRPGLSVSGRMVLRPIDDDRVEQQQAAGEHALLPGFVFDYDTPADELV